MKEARVTRNLMIKAEVKHHLELGLSLKEALYVVADNVTWGLTWHQIKRIYYETIEDKAN